MAKEELVLEIIAEIDELKKAFGEIKKKLKEVESTKVDTPLKRFKESAERAKSALSSLKEEIFSLKTAIVGAFSTGITILFSKSVIDTASRIEQLRTRISLLGKEAQQNFEALYEYARQLPFPIEQTIETLISLQAQGLRPTQEQFKILLDTVAALGGSRDTLEGIARALAQIQTKGKAQLEELYQLAERGVPVFEILKEELRLTGEQLQNIAQSGLTSSQVLEALFRGLEKRFGGFTEKYANTWSGLVNRLTNIWEDFKKSVADTGYFRALKKALDDFVKWANSAAGRAKLKEWARETGKALLTMIQIGVTGFKILAIAALQAKKALESLKAVGEAGGLKGKELLELAKIKAKQFAAQIKGDKRRLLELKIEELYLKTEAAKKYNALAENYQKEIKSTEKSLKTLEEALEKLEEKLNEIKENPLSETPEGRGNLGKLFSSTFEPVKQGASQVLQTLEKLRQEWEKTRKELSLSLSEPFMDEWDRKLLEINRKADELKEKFKDIEGANKFIEQWRKAQIEIIKAQKEQEELNTLLKEYEKEFEDLEKKEIERIEVQKTILENKLKEELNYENEN